MSNEVKNLIRRRMSNRMATVEQIIFDAGMDLEHRRAQVVDDAAHAVVEFLAQRALDDLATELGRDLGSTVIDTISIEMELESLADEIRDYIDAGETTDSLEERYLDEVRELVRQQIEGQEDER